MATAIALDELVKAMGQAALAGRCYGSAEGREHSFFGILGDQLHVTCDCSDVVEFLCQSKSKQVRQDARPKAVIGGRNESVQDAGHGSSASVSSALPNRRFCSSRSRIESRRVL